VTSTAAPWWRDAVVYQIYVRSFADADGDGMGDLPGIRSRLPYVRALGVDALWLNPFYPSPQVDAGYDVADYRSVDPAFGTLADADALIADAHTLGLRVLVDLVPNHTSDQHAWFQAALAAEPGSRERARYLFRDGRGPRGDRPPNDWRSVFGGPAWTRVPDGQWYLHLFAAEQPDLDWTNPEVRTEFLDVLRFWLDRGADGFRIDVAHGLAKDPAMPDLAGRFPDAGPAPAGHPYWDQDTVHEVYRGWREVLDSYAGDRVFVAEAWVETPEQLARYLRPDELHTAFSFDFLLADWDATGLRNAVKGSLDALAGVGAVPTWVLSSHDAIREATRYGGGPVGTRRARAAALLMLALPGSAYLYQGEELGLFEVLDLPDDLRQDPTFFRTAGAEVGRDGCRVPIPWSGTEPSYGFGPGPKSWLPQPPEWGDLSVAVQEADPASTLELFRAALRLRRSLDLPARGGIEWLDLGAGTLAFRRGGFLCVVRVDDTPVPLPAAVVGDAELVLASTEGASATSVPGATAAWYATTSA